MNWHKHIEDEPEAPNHELRLLRKYAAAIAAMLEEHGMAHDHAMERAGNIAMIIGGDDGYTYGELADMFLMNGACDWSRESRIERALEMVRRCRDVRDEHNEKAGGK